FAKSHNQLYVVMNKIMVATTIAINKAPNKSTCPSSFSSLGSHLRINGLAIHTIDEIKNRYYQLNNPVINPPKIGPIPVPRAMIEKKIPITFALSSGKYLDVETKAK